MNPMLKQTLYLQWKIARWPLVPFVLAAFALPLAALTQAAASPAGAPSSAPDAIIRMSMWVPLFPITAALTGVVVGLMAWAWDHRANHVYALSLPLTRTRYTLLKLAAGGLILLVPVVAAWIGALVGSALADVPDGLREYPNAFALRFLLAAVVMYAAVFAFAAGTMRTAIYVISGFVLFLTMGSALVTLAEAITGVQDLWTPIQIVHAALADWPGPFHVFGGNWMLIDV